MAKAASFSPLQSFSPIQLIFCFVLFFLPWIELQCSLPPDMMKTESKAEIEDFKKKTGLDPSKPIGMVSQSGLQIATGDASLSSDYKKAVEKEQKEMGGKGGKLEIGLDSPDKKKDGAPLLFLYPVLVVAGIVLGFLPWPGMVRRFILLGCCLAALGVVGLQFAIGVPMERDLKKTNEQMKGGFGMGGMPGPAPAKGKTETKQPDMFRVAWKLPLYLTFLLLLGAAGTSILGGPTGGNRKPRRAPYDFDDDDDDDDRPRKKKRAAVDEDDEEDERPRKKKKPAVDEDDDYDDRPQRKKKPVVEDLPDEEDTPKPRRKGPPASSNPFEVVDDDPPPAKKPRRRDDDDEDDDRPRKKRRRDDD